MVFKRSSNCLDETLTQSMLRMISHICVILSSFILSVRSSWSSFSGWRRLRSRQMKMNKQKYHHEWDSKHFRRSPIHFKTWTKQWGWRVLLNVWWPIKTCKCIQTHTDIYSQFNLLKAKLKSTIKQFMMS